jgi:hypothetical protein
MSPRLRVRNSSGERILLAAGAGALLLAAAAAILPQARAVTRLTRQAAADAAAIRAAQVELAPLAQALTAAGDNPPTHILGASSAQGAVPDLLDRLSTLGNDCSVAVLGMTPEISAPLVLPREPGAPGGDPAAGRQYAVLTVRIEAEADFGELGRYFQELARLDVPLAVLSLHIAPAARGGSNRIAARFTLGSWVIVAAGAVQEGRDAAA